MKILSHSIPKRAVFISILTDLSALAFIYLVPTITHLFNFPVYLIEPMRLMLIIALVHTSKRNAYILALTMPLFSLLISGHPAFPKVMLIAFELAMNVFLFYVLTQKIKYIFPSILVSVILSKACYYLLKFMLIKFAFINTELISTPILIQVATTILFSLYVFAFFKKQKR